MNLNSNSVIVDPQILRSIVSSIIEKLCLRRKVFVGIAGPQGSGKSTIANFIANELVSSKIQAAVISLDDFYLPYADRKELSKLVHPLLLTRGVPGTHNVDLLQNTLHRLSDANVPAVCWPMFSKKLDDTDPDKVHSFQRNPTTDKMVIILEGWCVGCMPLKDIDEPVNDLERTEDSDGSWRKYVDEQIRAKYSRVWDHLDMLIYMRIPNWSYVKKWRSEQAATTNEDLTVLKIDRFIQFFERISKQMMKPSCRRPTDLEIELDTDHRIKALNYNSR